MIRLPEPFCDSDLPKSPLDDVCDPRVVSILFHSVYAELSYMHGSVPLASSSWILCHIVR